MISIIIETFSQQKKGKQKRICAVDGDYAVLNYRKSMYGDIGVKFVFRKNPMNN